MDRDNTIARLENIAKHAVHTAGEDIFILNLDDGLAIHEAIEALKAQLSQEGTTSDLISRQVAIDALNEYFARIGKLKRRGLTEGEKAISLDTVGTIKTLPPAQPEPKEGHWIEGKIYRDIIECNCSECGQLMTTAATVRMNYCPNCGAKMTISK